MVWPAPGVSSLIVVALSVPSPITTGASLIAVMLTVIESLSVCAGPVPDWPLSVVKTAIESCR